MTESSYPPYPKKLGVEEVTPAGGEPYYPPMPAGVTTSETSPSAGGGAPVFNRQNFVKSYASMVAQTWIDDTYLNLILAKPAETLAKAGLPTPDGAVIRIIQCKLTGMGSVSEQADVWAEGYRTGRFDLYLPIKPDDLEIGEAGGVGVMTCCSCTPCCCSGIVS